MTFYRPKLLVSSCLGFEACRYNGQKLHSRFLEILKTHVDIIHVCPEVEIGLGIPRLPIHLEQQDKKILLIQKESKIDLTHKMQQFSENFLHNLGDIDGAILKSKSPSCGINNVKMQRTSPADNPYHGRGMFAQALREKNNFLPMEDEGRLLNYNLREVFLTKIFCLAAFRDIQQHLRMADLVKFHAEHKYLFMWYHAADLKILGNIVANHDQLSVQEVFERYLSALFELFSHTPNKRKAQNVLQHVYGHFKDKLRTEEKQFFAANLEMYLEERIPFSTVMMLIQSRALQYQEKYILAQKLLNPFPAELLELYDSGKHGKL